MKANEDMEATLETEGFISVARAAELMPGLRKRLIYQWIQGGHVKPRRVGSRVFVRREDVQDVLLRGVKR